MKGKNYKKRVDIGKPTDSGKVSKELTALEKPTKGKTRKGSFQLDQAENYQDKWPQINYLIQTF